MKLSGLDPTISPTLVRVLRIGGLDAFVNLVAFPSATHLLKWLDPVPQQLIIFVGEASPGGFGRNGGAADRSGSPGAHADGMVLKGFQLAVADGEFDVAVGICTRDITLFCMVDQPDVCMLVEFDDGGAIEPGIVHEIAALGDGVGKPEFLAGEKEGGCCLVGMDHTITDGIRGHQRSGRGGGGDEMCFASISRSLFGAFAR